MSDFSASSHTSIHTLISSDRPTDGDRVLPLHRASLVSSQCQTSHSRSKREKKGPSFMYYRHLSSLENKRQYCFLLCIFVYFELYKVMLFCFTPWFCLCFNKLEERFKQWACVLSIQKNIRDQEHSANIISECSLNIQNVQFEPFLNIKGIFIFPNIIRMFNLNVLNAL